MVIGFQNEWWTIRELKVGEGSSQLIVEEELYVKDRTATWSQGTAGHSGSNMAGEQAAGRTQVCSYTVDSTITHALWVNFIKPGKTREGIPTADFSISRDVKSVLFSILVVSYIKRLKFRK